VLGAAGLLKGYRATTHWASHDQLAILGAEPVDARVVFDRNRITGAGVTSGIDFALAVAAHLAGEEVAKQIQLQMEYDPAPPFSSGSPSSAGPIMTAQVMAKMETFQAKRREVTLRAAAALKKRDGQQRCADVATRKLGLSPVLDQNTEVLILGSLPSDISLSKGEYYGNPNNDFWKILADVLGQPLIAQPYEERRQVLLQHKIGLWDVYHQCVRPGSMDKDITETEPNDFVALKDDAPKLKLVCFNGKEAGESAADVRRLKYDTIVLPSSSGANRSHQADRLNRWRSVLQPWISRLD
jgi:hypoxanthine-DNA glycosylase